MSVSSWKKPRYNLVLGFNQLLAWFCPDNYCRVLRVVQMWGLARELRSRQIRTTDSSGFFDNLFFCSYNLCCAQRCMAHCRKTMRWTLWQSRKKAKPYMRSLSKHKKWVLWDTLSQFLFVEFVVFALLAFLFGSCFEAETHLPLVAVLPIVDCY